jgi:hypothetical protein
MRREESIQLPFLGSRNYLQGTTLFSSLWKYVPADSQFVFKLPRFIRSDRIQVTAQSADEAKPKAWDAILDWSSGDQKGLVTAVALERTGNPVREPYDEEIIVSRATFSKSDVVLKTESPVDFVPTIVSLKKAYLLRSEFAAPYGQWIFTRLDLSQLPTRTTGLALKDFTFGLGHTTCKSKVAKDGAELGDLYFAWIQPSH